MGTKRKGFAILELAVTIALFIFVGSIGYIYFVVPKSISPIIQSKKVMPLPPPDENPILPPPPASSTFKQKPTPPPPTPPSMVKPKPPAPLPPKIPPPQQPIISPPPSLIVTKSPGFCNDGNTYEITSPNSIYESRTRKPTSYITPGGSIQLGIKNKDTGKTLYDTGYEFQSSKPDKVSINGNIATDMVKDYDDYDMFIDITMPSSCSNVLQPMRVIVGDPFLGTNIAFIYPKSIVPSEVAASGSVHLSPNQPWATISVDKMMKTFDFVRITDLAYSLEKQLFGIAPFANDVILFGLMPPWCGGAGQPTGLGAVCLIQPTNEPHWGVVYHEMGHDFTGHFLLEFGDGVGVLYPSNRNIFVNWGGSHGLTFEEGIATLAQMYSIRHLVDDSQLYGISGSILESLKKQLVSNNGYLDDLATYESKGNNFATINANILDGMFINLANDKTVNPYGWGLYPKAFKIYLGSLPSFITGPLTEIQGHTYFIAGLSAAAGVDLRPKFKAWNFPIDDAYYAEIFPKIKDVVK